MEKRFEPWRIAIAVVMAFALVMTLSWLQGRFDSSDHKKAIDLVKSYHAREGGPTIPDLVRARHPYAKDHEISWSSEILSSCLGTVRVTGYVPKKGEHPAATYAFDVRLTDPSIHPTDPDTVEILKSLGTRTSSAAAAQKGDQREGAPQ